MRRLIHLTLALALAALAFPGAAVAADTTSVRALLINASKGGGGSDPRLAPYEATLKRTLPFDTFKLAGQGSANLAGGGDAAISLGGGHRIELAAGEKSGRGIRVRVEWTHNGRTVMATSLTLQPGVPAVLGRGGEGEVPVVLVIAK